jgi:hypothetical protein
MWKNFHKSASVFPKKKIRENADEKFSPFGKQFGNLFLRVNLACVYVWVKCLDSCQIACFLYVFFWKIG